MLTWPPAFVSNDRGAINDINFAGQTELCGTNVYMNDITPPKSGGKYTPVKDAKGEGEKRKCTFSGDPQF